MEFILEVQDWLSIWKPTNTIYHSNKVKKKCQNYNNRYTKDKIQSLFRTKNSKKLRTERVFLDLTKVCRQNKAQYQLSSLIVKQKIPSIFESKVKLIILLHCARAPSLGNRARIKGSTEEEARGWVTAQEVHIPRHSASYITWLCHFWSSLLPTCSEGSSTWRLKHLHAYHTRGIPGLSSQLLVLALSSPGQPWLV